MKQKRLSNAQKRNSFSQYYNSAAVMLLNVLLLFVLVNVAAFVYLNIKDRHIESTKSNPVSRLYGNETMREVYPELAEKVINDLLHETWSRPLIYEPFTQFKEASSNGRYVNVDRGGFRVSKNQGPWPLDPTHFNIFMFGGSTLFGYGVSDGNTISSHLQDYLDFPRKKNIRVYNFGRGSFYSVQERILFEDLISSGNVPDLAIFLDGLNDFFFHDGPRFTKRLRKFFRRENRRAMSEFWLSGNIPIIRFAEHLGDTLEDAFAENEHASSGDRRTSPLIVFNDKKYNDRSVIDAVITRYLQNKRLVEVIGKAYGVQLLFVWQPVPTYRYDLRHHPFAISGFGKNSYSRYGYRQMERLHEDGLTGKNFLWIAGMQEHSTEALYVDKVHYSSRMSKMIASEIGERILGWISIGDHESYGSPPVPVGR